MLKYIIIAISLVSIFSCKENEMISDFPETNSGINQESKEFNARGKAHNEELQFLLENLPAKTTAESFRENAIEVLSSRYSEEFLSTIYWYDDYSSPHTMLEELNSKGLISKALYNQTLRDFESLDTFTEKDSMNDWIEDRLNNLPRLTPVDQQRYLNFLSVLKHSFHFWDPNGLNGAEFFGSTSGRIQFYDWIKRLIAIAEADAVTTMIDLGGGGVMPYTTFDVVQSGYFHFRSF